MNSERIKELEKRIAELKSRWPAHSVPPTRVSASPCLHVPTRFLSRKLLMRCPILIRLCVLAVVCVLRPAL
jgi:hypothetical protein